MLPALDGLDIPTDLKAALDRAVAKIVDIADPEVVILFGSLASGAAHDGSDVDLLVVADTASRIAVTAELMAALEPVLEPRQVDVILAPSGEWPRARMIRGMVYREADRKGIRLYERAA